MWKKNKPIYVLAILLLTSLGFASQMYRDETTIKAGGDFKKYWFDGNAEVCSYDLEQDRYGEIRKGDAVVIFVTEDFLKDKHVKPDRAEEAGAQSTKVMKVNFTREFRTGIYPYHVMSSVFTAIDDRQTLKASHSVQEWCGHTYLQLNRMKNQYKVRGFSYFEKEVETNALLEAAVLEDEIWNLLRIDPRKIKTGNQRIIMSGIRSRMSHKELAPEDGNIQMKESSRGENGMSKLIITLGKRILTIDYETDFPHTILGWEEVMIDENEKVISRAKLRKKYRIPYWQLNHNEHSSWRDSLSLNIE